MHLSTYSALVTPLYYQQETLTEDILLAFCVLYSHSTHSNFSVRAAVR